MSSHHSTSRFSLNFRGVTYTGAVPGKVLRGPGYREGQLK